MNVGSLFAGIGGFDLGFERAGMHTLWQVEQDPYCQAVLAKNFPDAARFDDVCTVGAHNLEPVDLICGGFPCQDISLAGKGAGIDGSRSGLWSEYARIVRELEPRWVVVENVPALTSRGLDRVLRDLAEVGYDAEWDCIPASALGAPHRRDRIWLVAYPGGEGRREDTGGPHGDEAADAGGAAQIDHVAVGAGPGGIRAARGRGDGADVADSPRDAEEGATPPAGSKRQRAGASSERNGAPILADSDIRSEGHRPDEGGSADHGRQRRPSHSGCEGGTVPHAGVPRSQGAGHERPAPHRACEARHDWAIEPDVGRVADGVPSRVDRLSALGNALVPQIAEWIGRRILDYEQGRMNPPEHQGEEGTV